MKLATFLRTMIAEEEAAQKKYALAAAEAENDETRDLLERLAYEEEIHADLLRQHVEALEG